MTKSGCVNCGASLSGGMCTNASCPASPDYKPKGRVSLTWLTPNSR